MPTPEKRLRLMQLASSNLPVGGYSWSQGLEWAVEAGWVPDAAAFERWQLQQMEQSFLPSICRCSPACTGPANGDLPSAQRWTAYLLACRRPANCVKKSAIAARPLPACWPTGSRTARRRGALCQQSQLAGMAWLGVRWQIALPDLALSLGYSWIESAVMAGVKLVPFGQQAAQQLILRLCDRYAADMACALARRTRDRFGHAAGRHRFRPA
jgi:urease accessory protein